MDLYKSFISECTLEKYPLTVDGLPLTTQLSDLVPKFLGGTFPEERVADGPWALFLNPVTPVVLVAAYLISEPLLKGLCDVLGYKGKDPLFKALVALHNLVLIVFSAIVMVETWPLVINHVNRFGVLNAYCDSDWKMWNESNLGFWANVFYLSKYYEFIDTWVLIFKGRKPSLLQVYHHAGIVITMAGCIMSQGSWIAWVVCLNSAIHTMMYTYFFLSTLGIKIPGIQYLTSLQILQFLTGIGGTLYVQVLGASCQSDASRFVLAVIQTYAVGLIFLFSAFYSSKYKKKQT